MAEQTLPQLGTSIQEKTFHQPVVNIGSHPENDIVLSGDLILPFHASVTIQNGAYSMILLAPEAEAQLDGEVHRGRGFSFVQNQRLEIGHNVFLFQKNGSEDGIKVLISQPATSLDPETYELEVDEEAILVNVLTPPEEIDVEQTATFEIEVVNAGPVVASFFVSVEGIRQDVVEISPQMLNLNEGQKKTVTVSITPPRDSASEAGNYLLDVVVSSPNYRGHFGVGQIDLTIHPYYDFVLGNLNPRQQRIPWRKKTGKSVLPISNSGNTEAEFSVMALDEENGCAFDFDISEDLQLTRQATVTLPPGHTLDLPISITPHKQKLFAMRARRYHYTTTVQVLGDISSPQIVSGSVSSAPLFGWWAIVLSVITVVLGLFLLLQPTIHAFGVAAGKDIIELGDTTKLSWEVSPFVSRLNITNLEDVEISRGQTTLTVSPRKTTTYELVAGNWLSGIFGIDRSRSKTVLVIPPSPEIGVFEIDRDEVDKGQPVNVRWSVTKADTVFLTVDKVVYELPPAEFSGEQQFILNDDSIITLEAVNASGSELRSYFVNVVPPEITVNAFTVWVRPEGAAMNYQARKGLSPDAYLQDPAPGGIPDLNFPVKLVSLVPDGFDQDGGIKYRVEFFQPDRELDKGEQVMLQWDVAGVETVNISPFTEALPNKGVQPFFPQESMNFVMTAVSGELEKLYMLPVKVFDGEPPEAPKIEFFNAAPAELTAPGELEFAWSVSGEWTRVQISSGDSIAGDFLFAQGFLKYRVAESTTFILTAWNGDLSSAMPLDIKVSNKLNVKLEIADAYPTGLFQVGGKTTVTIDFPEDPDPQPTGTVYVTDGVSTCTIALPAKTCDLVFKTPGTKTITASYQGDDIYAQTTSQPFTGGTIEVQSAQVNLIPRFYDLDTKNPIPDIENVVLRMNQGLFISVEVQQTMLQAPLDDNKSHISVRVCDQNIKNCIFAGSATVKPADPAKYPWQAGGGEYFADIVIKDFRGAGLYTLVLDFINDTNSIDPTQFVQPNIEVGKMRVYLSLPLCQDPDSFTSCRVGVDDPQDMTLLFDIKVFDDQVGLSTLFPAPVVSGAGTPFELSVDSNPGNPWACRVVSKNSTSGPVHKLECNGSLGSGFPLPKSTFQFDYTFSNTDQNYYMGNVEASPFSNNFNLSVLQQSFITVGNLTGKVVGEPFLITANGGGIIQVVDAGGTLIPTLSVHIANAADFLDVQQPTNCSINLSGTLIIPSVNADCKVYFTKTGIVEFTATTPGDSTYSASSSQVISVSVRKQSNVTADWQYYSGTTYVDWANLKGEWTVNKVLNSRIELGGLTSYQPLLGRNLLIQLRYSNSTLSQQCDLQGTDVTETGANTNDFNVVITEDTNISKAVANFFLVCKTAISPDSVILTVAFSGVDQSNEYFDFLVGEELSKSLVIIPGSNINLTLSLFRTSTTGDKSITIPATGGIALDINETYRIRMRLNTFSTWTWGTAQPSLNPESASVSFSSLLDAELQKSNMTCDSPVSLQVTNLQGTTSTFWFWVWTDWTYELTGECTVKFDGEADFLTDQSIIVRFNSTNQTWLQAAKTLLVDKIKKQAVTLSYNPASPMNFYIYQDQNLVVTATPANDGTSLVPVNGDNFTFSLGTCTNAAADFVSNTSTTATYKLTSNTVCSNSAGTVNYNGTINFAPLTGNSITLSFIKHNSGVGAFTPTPSTFTQNTPNTVRVVLNDTDPGSHTPVFTDGNLEIWLYDNGAKTGNAGYSISCTNCTYSSTNQMYTIPVSDNLRSSTTNQVEFQVNFSQPLTDVKFQYQYRNSAKFNNSTTLGNSSTYTVVNQSPTVTITAPAPNNGGRYDVPNPGMALVFSGTASDPEDGNLTSSIVWSSSPSGVTGTGANSNSVVLDPGTYTVTATVTDSTGNTSTDTLTVVMPNAAPVITVTSPASSPYNSGDGLVTFAGTATDLEDGNISSSLVWTSDLDGVLSPGGASFTLTTALTKGRHTITVSVTDSNSSTSSTQIIVIVPQ